MEIVDEKFMVASWLELMKFMIMTLQCFSRSPIRLARACWLVSLSREDYEHS